MTVHYVLGRAGLGKSQFIYKDIFKHLNDELDISRLILLVPEQFVLQVKRDLITSLNIPGIMQVEVMSISSLARKIFNEEGGRTRVLLNKQGKNMVLQKVLEENVRELSIFKKAAGRAGFINKLSDFISLLKQEGVLPEEMLKQTPAEEIIMLQKLKDITLLYKYFNEYIEGSYIDAEDRINLLLGQLDKSDSIKGARVWIDGFNSFSTQNLLCIEKIMQFAQDITIALTIDNDLKSRDRDLFLLPRRSYRKIHELAVKCGLPEQVINIEPYSDFYNRNKVLLHLEKELFAYPEQKYEQDVDCLHIMAALNRNDEIENIARTIITLVRENGYRWRDIAIICTAIDNYDATIKRVFRDYSIPYFIDRKRDVMDNPIIQFVLAVIDIVCRGYQYEDIFRLFKTGFSDLQVDEYEMVENYVLEFGIRGNKWANDFELGNKEVLTELNRVRLLFMDPILAFDIDKQKDSNFRGISKVLYEYFSRVKLREKINVWVEQLRQQGHYELANENTRIWNNVIKCLDQLVEILGDQTTTLVKFRAVLEAGFLELELRSISTTVDQVLVGGIQSSTSHDLKAIFIAGANDGSLPAVTDKEDLLSVEEKEILRASSVELGIDRETKASEENLLIYGILSKASEGLYFSYALADEEGRALRPSLFVDRLKRLFPALEVKSNILLDPGQEIENITSPLSSFNYLIEKMRLYAKGYQLEDYWWDVYNWYYKNDSWRPVLLNIVEGLFHNNQRDSIGWEKAHGLYRTPLRASVSRLEKFVQCPFAHFVQYGLKPAQRREFVFDSPDMGQFYHVSLQKFAEKLMQQGIKWHLLENKKIPSIVQEVTNELQAHFAHGILGSSSRYLYWHKRLTGVLTRTGEVVIEQIKGGDFEPRNFEVRFGEGGTFSPIIVELKNGDKLILEGRIDRVDWLDTEDAAYVRVVDYKSSFKNFSLSDAYNGLGLQLLIYLMAVINNTNFDGREIKPAAMLYFQIDDPMVEVINEQPDQILKAIRKKFKMQGLVLEDVFVVRKMDKDMENYSDIIPVALTKKDEFYKNSSVLREDDFNSLMNFGRKIIKCIGEKIMQGNIKIEPYALGKRNACIYCEFKAICQFDKLLSDNSFRSIKNFKDEEIMQFIKQENGGDMV